MPGASKKEKAAAEYDDDKMKGTIPADPNFAFDTHEVIKGIVDAGSFFELRKGYAAELITGFGRVEGRTAGFIANNSCARGGLLFPESCRKSARFISICSAYGIPLVFLADVPGFMVGPEVEKNAIIKDGAMLFSTIANSRVPKLSITLRRNYTAGVYAMAGPGFEPESFIALPEAVISIYGKSVAEKLLARETSDAEKKSMSEMISAAGDPKKLLEMGLLDAIVDIRSLRATIAGFLNKRRRASGGSGNPILLV
jgi:acetyl-CoA carboxylase carboxyltransferase component